jgi:hypothetical protein
LGILLHLDELGGLDQVVTCLAVVEEVLQGFRDQRAFRLAREAILSLPIVESPLARERFEEAADLYRAARRAGLRLRSEVDCAACALRQGLTVVHRDRDFGVLARISPLDGLPDASSDRTERRPRSLPTVAPASTPVVRRSDCGYSGAAEPNCYCGRALRSPRAGIHLTVITPRVTIGP